MSYFSTKKDVKSGTKCPQEQEDLIRALILKDALEKLKCTESNYKKPEKLSKPEEAEDIFSQIDNFADPQDHNQKPMIVLDAQNVAMRHGRDKLFSVKGI